MTNIYDDLDRATPGISAFAILSDGSAIGRVIIRRKTAVTAYLQVWGAPMEKGQARGGGYDMSTAALEVAAAKLTQPNSSAAQTHRADIQRVMADPKRDGQTWISRLEDEGFQVATVI